MFNVKLKVDNKACGKIMVDWKLNIEWARCRTYDRTEIVHYMKCRGYNNLREICPGNISKMSWPA